MIRRKFAFSEEKNDFEKKKEQKKTLFKETSASAFTDTRYFVPGRNQQYKTEFLLIWRKLNSFSAPVSLSF